MTVVYAVGEKGVRGQMNAAIDKLLADPDAGVTPDLVAHIQANRTDMVNSLAYEMVGKGEYAGAVREVLDIPRTEELIQMVQSRDAVFHHRDVNVPMQEILTGDWKNREDANVVAHALKDEAKNVLGIDDLGLGLWLIKLRDSTPMTPETPLL